ncbi:MAG: RNA polymerase sigma factor [Acidimicrobiales bacterium]|jgi:RNA polymerase sigma-70 factor (ECF subfamily)
MPTEQAPAEAVRRFEAFYSEQYAAIYAYVHRRLTQSPGEVPDVVAEIFTVAWRRFDEVPAAPGDRLWLYGVARRCVLRSRRTSWRRSRLQSRVRGAVSEQPSPLSPRSIDPLTDRVRDAIGRLRPLDREVLRLVMWEELSHAAAAEVLGCSVNAVALRLHRARLRLRDELVSDTASDRASLSPGILAPSAGRRRSSQ